MDSVTYVTNVAVLVIFHNIAITSTAFVSNAVARALLLNNKDANMRRNSLMKKSFNTLLFLMLATIGMPTYSVAAPFILSDFVAKASNKTSSPVLPVKIMKLVAY